MLKDVNKIKIENTSIRPISVNWDTVPSINVYVVRI